MKLAYELKESYYNIFDNSLSRQAAAQEYDAWLKRIIPDVRPYFEPLTRAMENWHEEIFAYFDLLPNPVTNAYTESLHNLIKLINKNGRGYRFDVLRAKVLFSDGVRKVVTPKFNRRPASSGMARMMDMFVSEAGDDYQIQGSWFRHMHTDPKDTKGVVLS